jgi:ketosteroid isomerase-like protein
MFVWFAGGLKLNEGALLGKRPLGRYEPIRAEDIDWVLEYSWGDLQLLVVAEGHAYGVRPWSRHYDSVADWLEEHTGFKVKDTKAHRQNRLLFRLSPLRLFRRSDK